MTAFPPNPRLDFLNTQVEELSREPVVLLVIGFLTHEETAKLAKAAVDIGLYPTPYQVRDIGKEGNFSPYLSKAKPLIAPTERSEVWGSKSRS